MSNSFQNPGLEAPTSRPGGSKIEVQRRPGGILGRLGPSWAIRKVFGNVWEHLGGVLEASWAVLGRERWPTWVQAGSQNGAQIDKESIPKSIIF